jgi:2,3-bisphosphoglycerate-dependent phosphoglycerate mutase
MDKDKNLCTIYIVRHGETEWNVKGLLQGQKDSPLTKQGIDQAKNLGKRLQYVHFDKIFSSDSLRAKRTAELMTLEKEIAIETNKLLRERSFGPFEGKANVVMRDLRRSIVNYEKLSVKERAKIKVHPQVESDEEVVIRLLTFLREVAVVYIDKTILVVSHGALMRSLLRHLGETEIGYINNTGYIKLLSDGVDFFIKETVGIEKKT